MLALCAMAMHRMVHDIEVYIRWSLVFFRCESFQVGVKWTFVLSKLLSRKLTSSDIFFQ